MGTETGIEWTDVTWNPSTGCDKISPGCKNCYAEVQAERLQRMGNKRYVNGFALTLHHDKVTEPLRWREPKRVFVNSMSDILHDQIPMGFILDVWRTMVKASQHTFQVLTKRGERWKEVNAAVVAEFGRWPVNVWPGVTVESRRYLHRLEQLAEAGDDRTIRMVSFEPLLESLTEPSRASRAWTDNEPVGVQALAERLVRNRIGWGITGGEAGFGARGHDLEWYRQIRDAAAITVEIAKHITGTRPMAFFHKQHGGPGVTKTDKKGAEHATLDGVLHHDYPSTVSVR